MHPYGNAMYLLLALLPSSTFGVPIVVLAAGRRWSAPSRGATGSSRGQGLGARLCRGRREMGWIAHASRLIHMVITFQ